MDRTCREAQGDPPKGVLYTHNYYTSNRYYSMKHMRFDPTTTPPGYGRHCDASKRMAALAEAARTCIVVALPIFFFQIGWCLQHSRALRIMSIFLGKIYSDISFSWLGSFLCRQRYCRLFTSTIVAKAVDPVGDEGALPVQSLKRPLDSSKTHPASSELHACGSKPYGR